MRTPGEMLELIVAAANADERIRAVTLCGSRADKTRPADIYQDYDVTYYVRDTAPFRDNEQWIEERFGRPSLMQKPESIELIPPDGDGSYPYLMLFPDGNRIDLTFTAAPFEDSGEPYAILLDKDGLLPEPQDNTEHWNVTKPSAKMFADCCCEFHWCLNNAAKGIARDELSYAMHMLGHVRDMLILLLGWYAGARHDFGISVGKHGKYLKKYLPADIYERFAATYCRADSGEMWQAAFGMLYLFGDTARETAAELGFAYNSDEEKGIEDYMKLCLGDYDNETENAMKTIDIIGENYFGEWTETRTACRGLVIKDGMLLLSYETETGQYMIPGGGLEAGENERECCAREIAEETGVLTEPSECLLEIDEYYEGFKWVNRYFTGRITGSTEPRLTEREREVGMEPRWVPLGEIKEIFSRHADYYGVDEMRRGMYLREYTALCELTDALTAP